MAKWKPPHVPDLKAVLKTAHNVAREEALFAIEDYADDQRDIFVSKIEEQRFASFKVIFYPESGTNLSPQYLKRKIAADADERTMIATGHYVASIRVFRKGKAHRGPVEFRIGFHHSTQARNLDGSIAPIKLARVAWIQEHGSVKAKIPARPHWGPHANVMRRGAKKAREGVNIRIGTRLKKALPKYARMI